MPVKNVNAREGTFRRLRYRLPALGLLLAAQATVAVAAPFADPGRLPGSLIGGDSDVYGRDVAVAANGDLVVVGHSFASDLPVTDASSLAGGMDVFVARFDAEVETLIWMIYLGGSNDDFAEGVALDASGNVYVTGTTESTDFPTTGAYDASANGGSDVFVAKLAAANGAHVWSTYLGGSLADEARDIVVDGSSRAIVVGKTSSNNFPTASPFGSNAFKADAFVTRFAANGTSLQLSSYYGDFPADEGVAVDVDEADDIYVGVHGYESEGPYYTNEILKIDEGDKTLTWAHRLDPWPTAPQPVVVLTDLAWSAAAARPARCWSTSTATARRRWSSTRRTSPTARWRAWISLRPTTTPTCC